MEAEIRLNRLLEQRQKASRRFYENNKEELAKYCKKYVQQTGYYKQKIMCECGKTVTRGSMSSHKKSKIHETLLKQVQSNSLLTPNSIQISS